MQHPDEGTIHAWLDGELSVDEAAVLEAHTASCAECSRAVAEARGIIAASSRIVTALDAVPGGVIPESAPPVRPWYASTQLRAAAAVLFVAGTTLLVLDRQDKSFSEVTSRSAAAPMADGAAGQNSATMRPSVDTTGALQQEGAAAALKSSVPTPPLRAGVERDMAAEPVLSKTLPTTGNQAVATGPVAALSGKVSGVKVKVEKERDELSVATADAADARKADAPPAEIQRQRADAERRNVPDSSARDAVASLNIPATVREEVGTTTGAGAVGFRDLKAIRTDTTGRMTHTVYEVGPGVRVTLTETQPTGFQRSTTAKRSGLRGAVTEAVPLPPAATIAAPAPQAPATAQANVKPVVSIAWTDPVTGRGYVLSGPLTKEELEAIRRRLLAEKR